MRNVAEVAASPFWFLVKGSLGVFFSFLTMLLEGL